jgi:outer membrane immunogenic protein
VADVKLYSGAYIGLNGGYFSSQSKTSTKTTYAPNSYFILSDVNQINDTGSPTLRLKNFNGGLQGGFNHRVANFVIGAELDFDSFYMRSSRDIIVPYAASPPYAFTIQNATNTDWLMSVRPKIGWTSNKILIYTTAGLALSQITNENTFNDNYILVPNIASHAFESSSTSKVKTGWVIGCGFEMAMSASFSLKAEYLHFNFSNTSTEGTVSLNPVLLAGLSAPSLSHSANLTANVVRLGVNYKLWS